MIRPTPLDGARRARRAVLLLPWKPIRAGSKPARWRRPARRRSRRRGRGPPRRSSARPPCTGTPCRRSRRRTPAKRLAEGAGAGPEVGLVEDVRRGAVLARQVGHVDAADRQAPSALRAVLRPQGGDERVEVGRARAARPGPRSAPSACSPAGLVGAHDSHPLGRGDAEQVRPLANTIRVASTSSSRAGWRSVRSSSPMRQHPACRRTCGSGRRSPRGSARPGGARAARPPGDHRAGTPRARAAAALGPCVSSAGSNRRRRSMPRSAALRSDRGTCGRGRTARRRPGCRWLLAHPRCRGSSGVSVGVARERVAQRVDADPVDQVVELDDGAGPLGQPHRLAVLTG